MKKRLLSAMMIFLIGALATVVFAQDTVIHSGNVTKIDKDKGALEIINVKGEKESFTITDKDVLASSVWKKRLQVGDGVDVRTVGNKVVVVLRRNLPATIKGSPAF